MTRGKTFWVRKKVKKMFRNLGLSQLDCYDEILTSIKGSISPKALRNSGPNLRSNNSLLSYFADSFKMYVKLKGLFW